MTLEMGVWRYGEGFSMAYLEGNTFEEVMVHVGRGAEAWVASFMRDRHEVVAMAQRITTLVDVCLKEGAFLVEMVASHRPCSCFGIKCHLPDQKRAVSGNVREVFEGVSFLAGVRYETSCCEKSVVREDCVHIIHDIIHAIDE